MYIFFWVDYGSMTLMWTNLENLILAFKRNGRKAVLKPTNPKSNPLSFAKVIMLLMKLFASEKTEKKLTTLAHPYG